MPSIVSIACATCGTVRLAPKGQRFCSPKCHSASRSRKSTSYACTTDSTGKSKAIHILVAEKALGRPLPEGVEVHHHDENRQNNSNSNLVICQDVAYHRLLHVIMRVLRL